jgi:hypothetical protein
MYSWPDNQKQKLFFYNPKLCDIMLEKISKTYVKNVSELYEWGTWNKNLLFIRVVHLVCRNS